MVELKEKRTKVTKAGKIGGKYAICLKILFSPLFFLSS
jgi:hypothetical protein